MPAVVRTSISNAVTTLGLSENDKTEAEKVVDKQTIFFIEAAKNKQNLKVHDYFVHKSE